MYFVCPGKNADFDNFWKTKKKKVKTHLFNVVILAINKDVLTC